MVVTNLRDERVVQRYTVDSVRNTVASISDEMCCLLLRIKVCTKLSRHCVAACVCMCVAGCDEVIDCQDMALVVISSDHVTDCHRATVYHVT